MSKYEYIFFDLDGTITDSQIGIINSISYAMTALGEEIAPHNEYHKWIGPPLSVSLKSYTNLPEEKHGKFLELFRYKFESQGILENTMYEGIDICLKRLKDAGFKLCVASSKPLDFVKVIIENFGLTKYFDFMAGSDYDTARTTKAEVIEYAIENCKIADNSKILMVGDRLYDVEGAKIFNIDCLGVTYGYGSFEELKEAGADFIVNSTEEIADFIIGL